MAGDRFVSRLAYIGLRKVPFALVVVLLPVMGSAIPVARSAGQSPPEGSRSSTSIAYLSQVEGRVNAAVGESRGVATSDTLTTSNALLRQAASARADALREFEAYQHLPGAEATETTLADRTLQKLQDWIDLDARVGALGLVNSLAASSLSHGQEITATTTLMTSLNQLIQLNQAASAPQGKGASGTGLSVLALALACAVLLVVLLAWLTIRTLSSRRHRDSVGNAGHLGLLESQVGEDPENSRLRRDLSIAYLEAGHVEQAKVQARVAEELHARKGGKPGR